MSESPFLIPPEYSEMIGGWKEDKKREDNKMTEEHKLVYTMGRHIGAREDMDLSKLHGVDFMKIVEDKITANNSTRKNPTMVLDIGGGMHLFSDQLRAKFGHKVKVISTGLSRDVSESARGILEKMKSQIPHAGAIKKELHPDDSKMYSVFQLNKTDENREPKAEFDLISDTYGEQYYGLKGKNDLLDKYLRTIVSKLKPGGMATIFPFGNYGVHDGQKIGESHYQASEVYRVLTQLEELCEVEQLRKPNSSHTTLRLIKK
jgi:hypothetical protein